MTRSTPPATPTVDGEKPLTASEAPWICGSCPLPLALACPSAAWASRTVCSPDMGGTDSQRSEVGVPEVGVHAVVPTVTVLSVCGVPKPLPLRSSVHLADVWVATVAEERMGVREVAYV